ncbi:diacylglycerol/lipid kinase family protein [Paenibacillus ferrarius]|uniref:diacylglycerol/lipid kinase family protein n=1 Tax=Paenibacillus ferrarius TaxID=1469647 RepID=UPI003D2B7DBB
MYRRQGVSSMKRIAIIVNPLSGNGRGSNIWREIETELVRCAVSYEVAMTTKPGDASLRATAYAHEQTFDLLLVIGGDGTVHEAANGLLLSGAARQQLRMGVIPAGTGNDFAKAYGVPRRPLQALYLALHGRGEAMIDVLALGAGTRVAVNSFGAGFDGMVAKVTNEAGYKKLLARFGLGRLAYLLSILRVFATYQPQAARLEVDGLVHELPHMWLCAIANIPYYGGAIQICPGASPTDGLADVVVIQSRSRLRLLPVLLTVYQGKHTTHPAVTFYRGTAIKLSAGEPLLLQADGEIVGSTPLYVHVVPGALRVCCAEGAANAK